MRSSMRPGATPGSKVDAQCRDAACARHAERDPFALDEAHLATLVAQMRGADAAGRIAAFTKAFRILLQSVLLAAGAYLVITVGHAGRDAGGIGDRGRALQPIEQVVGQWRPFLQYRDARARLANLAVATDAKRTSLPPPSQEISLANVAIRRTAPATPSSPASTSSCRWARRWR